MNIWPEYIIKDTDVKIVESDRVAPIRLYIFLTLNAPPGTSPSDDAIDPVIIPLSSLGADDLAQKLRAAIEMLPPRD